jgi:acetyl-CoA C-acetyltransferase
MTVMLARGKLEDSTPILVGCGDVTDLTTPIEAGRSPFDLMAQAAKVGLADAGAPGLLEAIDTVATLRLFSDTSHRFATKLGSSANPPKSVADRVGIRAARYIYTWNGGNMPQYLVNLFAEAISEGEIGAALITGGEAMRTQHGAERAGLPVSWHEDPGGRFELIGDPRRGWSDNEDRHKMRAAIVMYPLIENTIRDACSRAVPDHMLAMGKLFARFAAVAANNPRAIRREGYSAERLATVDHENRWIGFPYPRLMNSNAFVDQSAALILTSTGLARKLGIPPSKWVYLHGCADAHDHWYISERIHLHSSAAIRRGARKALDMAGRTLDDIRFFDLYSCFPSAVAIGCREIGLLEDDPRGLTVTGGLPYFGGPGNNYVTHSISEMMRQLRVDAGSFGMVTANGNYVTKHSFGVYSTTPFQGRWRRESPAVLQAELDALPKAPLVENACGPATVETYTVMHGKAAPEFGVVIGRLNETGQRFLANTPAEPAVLADLRDRESLGRPGLVRSQNGSNVFDPE